MEQQGHIHRLPFKFEVNYHHPSTLGPGEWYACEHPERPMDDDCWYIASCKKCRFVARAHLRMHGDCNGEVQELQTTVTWQASLASWLRAAEIEYGGGDTSGNQQS